MTARGYLVSRGWTEFVRDLDSQAFFSLPLVGKPMGIADALTVQRARDAEAERAAWVSFATGAATRVNGCDLLTDIAVEVDE